MKIQFKIIALVLAVFTFCSVFAVSAAEDKNAVADTYNYSDKMGLLLKLGVLNSEITDFSSNITRGEFVEAVMKLSGYENVGLGLIPPYSDVSESDSFYGAVSSAHSLGYIDGNGNFKPDEKVSLYEAADMLTAILGYVYVWDRYETKNPVMAAQRIGVTEGVSLSATSSVTKGDMIKMLYNSLFINVMKPTVYYYSDNFDLGSGETLLAGVFDVYKASGLVEATPLTSIYAAEGCTDGHININGILYKTDESYLDFIGHSVTCFYHSYDGTNTVIYMSDKYSDSEFTIDFSEVENITETELVYTVKNKERKKSIVKSASFLYNGKLKNFSEINKKVESGSITLTDSNGDGKYDVVNITEYVHGVVTGFSKSEFKVFTAQNKVFDMRAEKDVRIVELYSDGKAVAFDSLAMGDLISVAETTGKGINRITVYISKKSVEGTIMGLDDDLVKIDDTGYLFDSASFTPKVGDYGKFYIAFNDKVVIAELENYVVYGFLYKIIKKNDLHPVRAKIFSDKGRWVELDVADKITYNGNRIGAEKLLTAAELMNEGKFKPQLVAYRVNTEKKITVMNTAKEVKRWSDAEKEAISNAIFRKVDVEKNPIIYRNPIKSFDMDTYITSSSYMFVVPGSEGDENFDTSRVYLAEAGSFLNDNKYNVSFYDLDEWGNIGAAVVYSDVSGLDTSIYAVAGTGKGLDADGNVCNTVSVMMNGYKISLPVDSMVNFDALGVKQGDVIRYTSLNNGSIGNMEIAYRPKDDNYKIAISSAWNSKLLLYGIIDRIDLAANKILVTNGDKKYVFDISSAKEVSLFNPSRTNVRKATVADIPLGAEAYMWVNYGKLQQIIAYE